MKRIKSISEKRLIVEGKVNGKESFFLLDTGASVGLMDYKQKKDFGLKEGRSYGGTLVGAGGKMNKVKVCETFAYVEERIIPQFLLADIGNVVESIEQETGVKILGIIGLQQMKIANISLDMNDNDIILE